MKKYVLLALVFAVLLFSGSARADATPVYPAGWEQYWDSGPYAPAVLNDWRYDVNPKTNTAVILGYEGTQTAVTVPASIGGVAVDLVWSEVFRDPLESVTLIKMIGMISMARSLHTVTLPASVTCYDPYVFMETCADTVICGISGSWVESLAEKEGLCFAATDRGETNPLTYGTTSDGYTYTTRGGKAVITGYTGSSAVLNIPARAGNCPVTAIGTNAFFGSGQDRITEAHVPEGVTELGPRAFFSCWNMTALTLPTTLKTIGNMAISSCDALTSLTLPEGLTAIGEDGLAQCNSLTSLNIPSTVREIGKGAFSWVPCASLPFPEGITVMNDFVLWGASVTSFTVPSTVTEIREGAMSLCSSLRLVVIPAGVTKIHDDAFIWEKDPTTVTAVLCGYTGSAAEAHAKKFGLKFAPLDKPAASLVLPGYIKTVDAAALSGTAAEAVYIPAGCETVGSKAFENCAGLRTVHFAGMNTSIAADAFDNCGDSLLIRSPAGSTAQAFAESHGLPWMEE